MTGLSGGGAPRDAGRDLLGSGDSLAVERFRRRLLGRLDLPAGRGRQALDVGCGDGLEAVELLRRGWRVDAVDLEEHPRWRALRARWGARLRLKAAPGGLPRLPRGRYALVFQKDVLHHVPDPAALLRRLAEATAPGGELWALECNRRNPVSYLHLTLLKGHQHFTGARLRALAREAGLEGASLSHREARVYPAQSVFAQDVLDRVQDVLEALPLWRPFAVYHLLRWVRPDRAAKGGTKE